MVVWGAFVTTDLKRLVMLSAAQLAGFEVRHVESLHPHYARTLRHWVANLEAQWDEAS